MRYVVAIGSNRGLSRRLFPTRIVAAACDMLNDKPLRLEAASPVIRSRPIGPSARDYANCVVVVRTRLMPEALLRHLQDIEVRFARRRHRRWGQRTLDLDIILWDGGIWSSRRLTIPHRSFRERGFVIHPARTIASRWRDPVSGLRIAHLAARLVRPKPVDPSMAPR